MAGEPGRSTAFAINVAAVSAAAASSCEDGNGIGNAERKASTSPPAGGNAANPVPRAGSRAIDDDLAGLRVDTDADIKMRVRSQSHRAISPPLLTYARTKLAASQKSMENAVRNCTGHSDHRRDEGLMALKAVARTSASAVRPLLWQAASRQRARFTQQSPARRPVSASTDSKYRNRLPVRPSRLRRYRPSAAITRSIGPC